MLSTLCYVGLFMCTISVIVLGFHECKEAFANVEKSKCIHPTVTVLVVIEISRINQHDNVNSTAPVVRVLFVS